jgi:hypothetical protein
MRFLTLGKVTQLKLVKGTVVTIRRTVCVGCVHSVPDKGDVLSDEGNNTGLIYG